MAAASPIIKIEETTDNLKLNNNNNHGERKTPNSPQPNMSKTTPAPPFTPSQDLLGKRKHKWLKPPTCQYSTINLPKCSPSKDEDLHVPLRTSLSLGKEKANKDSNAPVQMSQTMIRAQEIQSTLGNEHPSFIKKMLRSNVTICFWIHLPMSFCRSYLPKEDSLVVIEDESGKRCDVKFIAQSCGLSAGWRGFAAGHKLLEGDVLIFQLVESCKFKIYIVRRNDSKEVDGDVNVINQDAHAEHISPGTKPSTVRSSYPPLTEFKRKYKRSKPFTQLSSHPTDHPVVNSQVQEGSPEPNLLLKEVKTFKDLHIMVNSQVQEGSPEPNLSLKEVKTFKDFHITVNKRSIDSELSEKTRMKYYNLCVGKNEILHNDVREGLFYKLVAGMIGETVTMADMIKNCKITTTKEEFDVWDSSLKSFELMGMKVGFLRERIRELANLTFESQDAKRYVEAKDERNRNAGEIKMLEAKLVELHESNKRIDGIVDGLKEKVERCEIEFQKKVDAPW